MQEKDTRNLNKEDFRRGSDACCGICTKCLRQIYKEPYYSSEIKCQNLDFCYEFWCEDCYNEYFNKTLDKLDINIKNNKQNIIIDLELLLKLECQK